tara:strand:+ start:683 stop:1105 length:423 start_codon:yes stop_codon:yes gene_type:complete
MTTRLQVNNCITLSSVLQKQRDMLEKLMEQYALCIETQNKKELENKHRLTEFHKDMEENGIVWIKEDKYIKMCASIKKVWEWTNSVLKRLENCSCFIKFIMTNNDYKRFLEEEEYNLQISTDKYRVYRDDMIRLEQYIID